MTEGISFMMRVRNEEQTLEQSVRSLFSLRIPYEIVIILHRCIDSSREIAERLQNENNRIRIFEYTVETSRAGYETLATDSSSPHSLMTYYTWCAKKTTLPWIFKWDGDFIASDGLIQFLNNGCWENLPNGGRFQIEARNSVDSNKEIYLSCGLFRYDKSMFWETPMMLCNPEDLTVCPENVYIIHKSELSDIKQHWTRIPWYTTEDSDDARIVQYRMNRLETDFGKEPNALFRCGNSELDSFFIAIQDANPPYVNFYS